MFRFLHQPSIVHSSPSPYALRHHHLSQNCPLSNTTAQYYYHRNPLSERRRPEAPRGSPCRSATEYLFLTRAKHDCLSVFECRFNGAQRLALNVWPIRCHTPVSIHLFCWAKCSRLFPVQYVLRHNVEFYQPLVLRFLCTPLGPSFVEH